MRHSWSMAFIGFHDLIPRDLLLLVVLLKITKYILKTIQKKRKYYFVPYNIDSRIIVVISIRIRRVIVKFYVFFIIAQTIMIIVMNSMRMRCFFIILSSSIIFFIGILIFILNHKYILMCSCLLILLIVAMLLQWIMVIIGYSMMLVLFSWNLRIQKSLLEILYLHNKQFDVLDWNQPE